MLLAPFQTNAPRIYYLWAVLYFQRTAVDLKQLINTQSQQAFSSGPDTDYRCHETWNLITSTLSFDAISSLQSSANTWLWHLRSSGLCRVGNCHFVEMRALEALVWEKRQVTGNWKSNATTSICTFKESGWFSYTICPICRVTVRSKHPYITGKANKR